MTRNRATLATTATVAGVLAVAAALAADRAEAQAGHTCLPQADLLAKQLGTHYGEHLTAAGVDANGGLVQVYSNTESGTWTIAVTVPDGPTCIVSSGEGWNHDKTAAMPKPGETT